MKKLFLHLTIFLLAIAAYAQNNEWEYFVPHKEATTIVGSSSKVWIGTTNGLIEFNKNTTEKKYYDVTNSGLKGKIASLFVDYYENLWVYYGNWLYTKFNGETWLTFDLRDVATKVPISSAIAVDKSEQIWFWSGRKIAFVPGNNKYQTFNTDSIININSQTNIYRFGPFLDVDGTVFFSFAYTTTYGTQIVGELYYDGHELVTRNVNEYSDKNPVRFARKSVYIGGYGCDGSTIIIVHDGIRDTICYSWIDNNGIVYSESRYPNHVINIHSGSNTKFTVSPDSNNLFKTFVNDDGYYNKNSPAYFSNDSLWLPVLTRMPGLNGNLVFSVSLFTKNGRQDFPLDPYPLLPLGPIRKILFDSKNNLWLNSSYIVKYDGTNWTKFDKHPSTYYIESDWNQTMYSAFAIAPDDGVWAAYNRDTSITNEKHGYYYSWGKGTLVDLMNNNIYPLPYTQFADVSEINDMTFDKSGKLWIACGGNYQDNSDNRMYGRAVIFDGKTYQSDICQNGSLGGGLMNVAVRNGNALFSAIYSDNNRMIWETNLSFYSASDGKCEILDTLFSHNVLNGSDGRIIALYTSTKNGNLIKVYDGNIWKDYSTALGNYQPITAETDKLGNICIAYSVPSETTTKT